MIVRKPHENPRGGRLVVVVTSTVDPARVSSAGRGVHRGRGDGVRCRSHQFLPPTPSRPVMRMLFHHAPEPTGY